MDKLERDIEVKLRRMVERHGGRCLKWVCPGWSGVPDRILLLPHGRILFVETKRPKGGRVDPLQRKWHKWLAELGFEHYFVHTEEQVKLLEMIIREMMDGTIVVPLSKR